MSTILRSMGLETPNLVTISEDELAPEGSFCIWSEDIEPVERTSSGKIPVFLWVTSGDYRLKPSENPNEVAKMLLQRFGLPPALLLTQEDINSPVAPWVGPHGEVVHPNRG